MISSILYSSLSNLFTKSNEPLPRVGEVPILDVSGDVPAYGMSGDVPVLKEWRSNCWASKCSQAVPNSGIGRLAKSIASFKTPYLWGPIFSWESIFGRFWSVFGWFRTRSRGFLFRRFWADFSTVLDVDFGYFCPRLQFDVKRRVYLCFRPLGTRF